MAIVSLLAGFLLEVAEHGGAEESVGLVAFALLAKPSDDVRIEAKGVGEVDNVGAPFAWHFGQK